LKADMGNGSEKLARDAAAGVTWAFLAVAAGRLISLASLVVLARLLDPADFGLVALALVYMTYVETVGDLGAGAALVYWPSRSEDAVQVTFLINVLMGWAWFVLTLLLAPAVAAFFHNPSAEPIFRALAWSFPIKALSATHDSLCQKDLRFRARLVPEIGMAGIKALVAIFLARAGFGAWSLVWGQLAGLSASTILFWIVVPWRPVWRWPSGVAGPILAYGRGIVAVNVIAAVLHHADVAIVGRTLGAAALGFYQMAYKIPEMTVTTLVWVVSRVLFPTFSRARAEGGDLREAYLGALRYVSLLTLPAAVGLALLSEPLVLTFFGERWRPTVPILAALATYTGLRSLGTTAGDVLKAMGRPGLLAALGVLKASLLVPALLYRARGGPVDVATTLAGVTALTTLLSIGVASRMLDASGSAILGALRQSLLAATTVALALVAWRSAVAAGPGSLAGGLLVGLVAYVATLRVLCPEVWRGAIKGPRGEGWHLRPSREDRLAPMNEP